MKREWNCVNLNREEADLFRKFLRDAEIAYEPSEMGEFIHFEVFVNEQERTRCDAFLSGF